MHVSRAHGIADDLRSQITTGQLQAGQRLPAEAELATRYGVSTATLRNALGMLQAEGLVEKIHSRGNFVRRPLRRATYVGGCGTLDPRTAADAAQRVGIRTTKTTGTTEHPAALLARPTGTTLTETLCITYDGEVTHGLARTYIPHDTASPPGLVADNAPHPGPAARFAVLTRSPAEVREAVCSRPPPRTQLASSSKRPNWSSPQAPCQRGLHQPPPAQRRREVAPTMTAPDLRLLPWTGPEGKPCYLSTDDRHGYMSRLADNIESIQLGMAAEVLDHATTTLRDKHATPGGLHQLAERLTRALVDTPRVADSRGRFQYRDAPHGAGRCEPSCCRIL